MLWTTALLAFSSFVTVTAVLFGRQQPLPESVAMLRLTDCELPCWIGIVPGKTTIGEARDRVLRTYPDLKFDNSTDGGGFYFFIMNSDRFRVEFGVEHKVTDDAVVERIWLSKNSGLAGVAEFYSTLSNYEQGWLDPNAPAQIYMALNKPSVYVLLNRTSCRNVTISQTTPVVILDPKFTVREWITSVSPELWRGFRSCGPR
jgi:hypothetical protein